MHRTSQVELHGFDHSTRGESPHTPCCSNDRTFAEELQKLVEQAHRARDYYELSFLVPSSVPATQTVGLRWACAPKTIGCLAISCIAADLLEDPGAADSYVHSILPYVAQAISSQADDLRDTGLLFLLGFLENASKESIEKLTELNIFNALVRYFLCSHENVRLTAAACCYKMYTKSVVAQTEFLRENGMKMLLLLIASSTHSRKQTQVLLSYLEALVVHCEKTLHKLVVSHLWVAYGGDTLLAVGRAVDCAISRNTIAKILKVAKAYQLSAAVLEPVEVPEKLGSLEDSAEAH